MDDTTKERFWSKVKKTSKCWEWTGARFQHFPYGMLSVREGSGKRRLHNTHRLSWEIHFGEIPKGMMVLHRCDNPPCVRPDHLFLGTQADNMKDKVEKGRAAQGESHGSQTKPGRMPRGAAHGNAKLNEDDVQRMREKYARGGTSQPDLAREYGLTQATVNSILLGETWAHAGGPIKQREKVGKLTEAVVRQIKKMLVDGAGQREVSRKFKVSQSTISTIANGKSWAHVT